MNYENVPVYTIRGDDLINILFHHFYLGVIHQAMCEMPAYENDPCPMDDIGELHKLVQGMADFLVDLPTREDGTLVYEEKPFIFKSPDDEQ